MSTITTLNPQAGVPSRLPTHLDLPETDGLPVENLLELPQSEILHGSLTPVLETLHPDGNYLLAADVGIYWKFVDGEPLRGCKSPDFYYVPNVPVYLRGDYRRSYVLWDEKISPELVIEYVSGDGSEERDRTPETGKFWVYERAIRAHYYAIWTPVPHDLEVYELVSGRYQPVRPNEAGRYPIAPLGVELGLWFGTYDRQTYHWLRAWDESGNLLPIPDERIQALNSRAEMDRVALQDAIARETAAKIEAEAAKAEADAAATRETATATKAATLAAKLRALGVDPDSVTG